MVCTKLTLCLQIRQNIRPNASSGLHWAKMRHVITSTRSANQSDNIEYSQGDYPRGEGLHSRIVLNSLNLSDMAY